MKATQFYSKLKNCKYRIFILLVYTGLLLACEPPVYYLSPQPPDVKNLSDIPLEYTGSFMNLKDSSQITISPDMVVQYEIDYSIMTREQLYKELDTVIDHDTLVYIDPNWTLEINLIDDSAEYISRKEDTLFIAGTENYIRKWKDILFLNMHAGEGKWTVHILKVYDDMLYFDELLKPSEIDSVKNIIEIKTFIDSTQNKITEYNLDPTKKELSQIMKHKEIHYSYARQ